jgi:hypothetical protein
VGPLVRVGALGEQTPKDVERCGRLENDPVRVLIDEVDSR